MISDRLKSFAMENCNSLSTPAVSTNLIFGETPKEKPYNELLGSPLYLSTTFQPDISFDLSYLSFYMDNGTNQHWNMVLQVIKHLKGTQSHGPFFGNKKIRILDIQILNLFVILLTQNATSMFVFLLNCSAISWTCKK